VHNELGATVLRATRRAKSANGSENRSQRRVIDSGAPELSNHNGSALDIRAEPFAG